MFYAIGFVIFLILFYAIRKFSGAGKNSQPKAPERRNFTRSELR
jgi:hypothetical protein